MWPCEASEGRGGVGWDQPETKHQLSLLLTRKTQKGTCLAARLPLIKPNNVQNDTTLEDTHCTLYVQNT